MEATTVNPSTSGVLKEKGTEIEALDAKTIQPYLADEMPIRFGSPLFSKLGKKYWELEHCKGLPLVLAIEAFHDPQSLTISVSSLINYLYGSKTKANWNEDFDLEVTSQPLDEHTLGDKTIPSNFFSHPDVEHVSAVLFTNSGTVAKFSRMGFQHGFGTEEMQMVRKGTCYSPSVNAKDPASFYYGLDAPPFVEPWGQGLVVLHNPNANIPISKEYFPNAVQCYLQDGLVTTDFDPTVPFQPFTSVTIKTFVGKECKDVLKGFLPQKTVAVVSIDKEEFDYLVGMACDDEETEQSGWYIDECNSFVGCLLFYRKSNHFAGYVFARDQDFKFIQIKKTKAFEIREEAVANLNDIMMGFVLGSAQRMFIRPTG